MRPVEHTQLSEQQTQSGMVRAVFYTPLLVSFDAQLKIFWFGDNTVSHLSALIFYSDICLFVADNLTSAHCCWADGQRYSRGRGQSSHLETDRQDNFKKVLNCFYVSLCGTRKTFPWWVTASPHCLLLTDSLFRSNHQCWVSLFSLEFLLLSLGVCSFMEGKKSLSVTFMTLDFFYFIKK